ncbi:hypothetical protein BJL95_10080 [Methylomonas sp. LWB]|nr:hypothetical protein BJL95_10080 [Methylomonas sp. LWB]
MLFGGLLLAATFNAQATLTTYTNTGADLVYSSVSDVTWTADANLLGTMMNQQGYGNVVGAILAVTSVIYDTPNSLDTPANSGQYTLSSGDFSASTYGQTNWFGAIAFINYLNSINYGGGNQWRLPSAGTNPQADTGQTTSELGQLYYTELNGIGGNGNALPDSSFFINEPGVGGTNWTGTEAQNPRSAWTFNLNNGNQSTTRKNSATVGVWAISSGQIAPVPLPGAAWLFASGLAGLIGYRKRTFAGIQ